MEKNNVKLVLDNGTQLYGTSFGTTGRHAGEIVTNTSVVGYQEIISDPAYAGQIIVMTYPMVGHYGITAEDNESRNIYLGGMVFREGCDTPSNFRYIKTLSEELEEHGIPCICGLDTRMLSRMIRDGKCSSAAIVEASMPVEEALEYLRSAVMKKKTVADVCCTKRWFSRTPEHSYDVVAIDCGIKHSIISTLNSRGCNVTVLPYNAGISDVIAYNPDGILISSGPGSPEDLPEVVSLIREARGKMPMFGIGLGHQLIGLAYGASVERLKNGHHGGHPVKDLQTGRICSAEHNHGYTVSRGSVSGTGLEITHTDLLDGSVEGLECRQDMVFSVQYCPEGAPGPKDNLYLFDKFIKMMEDHKNA